MTRKHFREIARILGDSYDQMPRTTFNNLVSEFQSLLASDNPRFNRGTFVHAVNEAAREAVTKIPMSVYKDNRNGGC